MSSIARVAVSTWSIAVLAAALGGCASGGDGEGPDARGGPRRDSGPTIDAWSSMDSGPIDTGPRPDAAMDAASEPDAPAPRDAGSDAPDVCGRVTCMPFQYCMRGVCVDYPNCRGDGTCATAGDVCRSRRCVPGSVDVDGDGDPAATDCDETNASRSSRLPEICDTIDNNCNGAADDGDPAALCASSDAGGLCMAGGVCSCPSGTYDIDRGVPGCECTAAPALTDGTSCAAAIDVGDIPDTAGTMTVTGNAIDRDVWYRFRAVDTPDVSCDQFNIGIHLSAATAPEYEITVFRGSCDSATECDGFADYNFALDFREDRAGTLTGQCNCWTGTPIDNVSPCEDNTTEVFVRVRHRGGASRTCAGYSLTLSNGVD
ncbi:MAG: MopE-related protein [Sandaracinus sp.]